MVNLRRLEMNFYTTTVMQVIQSILLRRSLPKSQRDKLKKIIISFEDNAS